MTVTLLVHNDTTWEKVSIAVEEAVSDQHGHLVRLSTFVHRFTIQRNTKRLQPTHLLHCAIYYWSGTPDTFRFNRPNDLQMVLNSALSLSLITVEKLEENPGVPVEGFNIFIAQLSAGNVSEREWTYIRKDGTRLTVSPSLNELHDEAGILCGYLSTAIDICARKETEKALLHEKYFFDQLINSLPGIFYLYDSTLRMRR